MFDLLVGLDLIALLVLLIGALLLIRPTNRPLGKRILKGAGVAFALFFALGVIVAPPPTLDASASPTAAGTLVAQKVAKPAVPKVDPKPAFLAYYKRVLETGAVCDKAFNGAVRELDGSRYEAYPIASAARQICSGVGNQLRALPPPPSSIQGEARGGTARGLNICVEAYRQKAEALGTMMAVIDGDDRPSMVQVFRDQTAEAGRSTLLCVTEFTGAGMALGIKSDDIAALAK